MHERLSRSQEESEWITAKMRETIEKREELMNRYKATRERLVNLKKQRKDIVQDERRILHDQGSGDNPYEDPIPGAESWTLEQLNKSLEEFRSLYDKVDQLQTAYAAKAEVNFLYFRIIFDIVNVNVLKKIKLPKYFIKLV